MGRRFQARRSSGRFTRNTPENTMGLSIQVCPHCRRFNPRDAGTPPLETCHACGQPLDEESESPDIYQRFRDRWVGTEDELQEALNAFYNDIVSSFHMAIGDSLSDEVCEQVTEEVNDYVSNHYFT